MKKIRVGIVGYGNVGKGVEKAIWQNEDMELVGIFTRRSPETIKIQTSGASVYNVDDAKQMKNDIDVMLLCGGSAKDLGNQTPYFAEMFNVVDSFDTHADILKHIEKIYPSTKKGETIAIISTGWDPGLFSLNRLYGEAMLPKGRTYTFWGKGISQGHSDAIRKVDGVEDARQYTIPNEVAVDMVKNGENPQFTKRDTHIRDCYVVVKPGADKSKIENDIKSMPNYFVDYNTNVYFISKEELERSHKGFPHGGTVIRTGSTNKNKHNHIMEYRLTLDSNPEFTANIMVACARAAVRMKREGITGVKTIFDISPIDLSPKPRDVLIKELL